MKSFRMAVKEGSSLVIFGEKTCRDCVRRFPERRLAAIPVAEDEEFTCAECGREVLPIIVAVKKSKRRKAS